MVGFYSLVEVHCLLRVSSPTLLLISHCNWGNVVLADAARVFLLLDSAPVYFNTRFFNCQYIL